MNRRIAKKINKQWLRGRKISSARLHRAKRNLPQANWSPPLTQLPVRRFNVIESQSLADISLSEEDIAAFASSLAAAMLVVGAKT